MTETFMIAGLRAACLMRQCGGLTSGTYVTSGLQAVRQLHSEIAGLPGADACPPAVIIPLYAALPPEQQVSQPLFSLNDFSSGQFSLAIMGANLQCEALHESIFLLFLPHANVMARSLASCLLSRSYRMQQ